MENSFYFKFIDIATYTKDGEERAIVVVYSNFGFIANIFTSKENSIKVKSYALNHKDDVSPLIRVSYDRKTEKFRYFIKTEK